MGFGYMISSAKWSMVVQDRISFYTIRYTWFRIYIQLYPQKFDHIAKMPIFPKYFMYERSFWPKKCWSRSRKTIYLKPIKAEPSVLRKYGHFGYKLDFWKTKPCTISGTYRDENLSLQILLSMTQAGPGRTVKQEQEEISPNHVQRLNLISVVY